MDYVLISVVVELRVIERARSFFDTPAYTNGRQGFHTQNGDMVSLLVISTAESGGAGRLASNWHIYNRLAKTRPDLIHTMTEPWPCDK